MCEFKCKCMFSSCISSSYDHILHENLQSPRRTRECFDNAALSRSSDRYYLQKSMFNNKLCRRSYVISDSALVCSNRKWLTGEAASLTLGLGDVIASHHRAVCQCESTWLRSLEANRQQWPQVMPLRWSEWRRDVILFICFVFGPSSSSGCQPDCLGVALYFSIFGFSGCCCLDMNHESVFSFPSGHAGR